MSTKLFSLEGKVAVVTGGTSGIGRAMALGLADAGADVVATGRREQQVNEAATEIEASGRKSLRIPSDVSDRASLEKLLAATLEAFGKVDILVNCAGIIKRTPTLDLSEEEWNNILNTNLTGTLRASQIFGRHMIERGYGRIVNIASLNSFVALTEVAAYAASKAGVAQLTRSLAVEWSKKGVTVNAIAPGVFRTDINAKLLDSTARGQELLMRTPMGRFGKTEELVGAAIYLASDASSFVTGEVLVVDGGFLASGVNQYSSTKMGVPGPSLLGTWESTTIDTARSRGPAGPLLQRDLRPRTLRNRLALRSLHRHARPLHVRVPNRQPLLRADLHIR